MEGLVRTRQDVHAEWRRKFRRVLHRGVICSDLLLNNAGNAHTRSFHWDFLQKVCVFRVYIPLEAKNVSLFSLNPKPSASSTPSWSSTDVYGFTHYSHLDRAVQWLTYQQRLMDPIRHTVDIAPVFAHWPQWEILSPWAEGRPRPSFHHIQAFYLPNIHRNSSHPKHHVQAMWDLWPSVPNTVGTGLSLKEVG